MYVVYNPTTYTIDIFSNNLPSNIYIYIPYGNDTLYNIL